MSRLKRCPVFSKEWGLHAFAQAQERIKRLGYNHVRSRILKMATTTVVVIVSLEGWFANGCYIHGSEIGYCEPLLYTDSEFRVAATPFCSSFLKYPSCVPKYNPLPPSRDFPNGRWRNNNMTIKDAWVEEYYNVVLASRLDIEGDKTLQQEGIDEYGKRGSPVPRFTDNYDCQRAFKAYMCYVNFPRCGDDGNSLVTCTSACENLMIACQNQKDLWRCGDSKYFNGYKPEEPTIDYSGDPVYLRDFFPGQPFRDLEWTSRRQPEIVCTPSVKGAASPSLQPWGKIKSKIRLWNGITVSQIGTTPTIMAITGLLTGLWYFWNFSVF